MTSPDKKHELREHLALISTGVYLLLRANEEDERIERYNAVQEQIDAIIDVLDDHKPVHQLSPDIMIR